MSSEDLQKTMVNIVTGKMSRNKHYFSLLDSEARRRFKRAKLLLSIISDIKNTSKFEGNQIRLKKESDSIEIQLVNPQLSYRRMAHVSEEEFELIKNQSANLISTTPFENI